MSHDRLYYFSRSANKPPGQGVNEHVNDLSKYAELAEIPNWRQMLSNFWVAPFYIDSVRFNTVEHMLQGYKINLVNPQLGYQFSLNSGSSLSRGPGDDAQKNRKAAILSASQLQQWEQIKNQIIYTALYAKFSQHSYLKRVLLLTHDAEL
jgi:N-glycosidase YbiA